MLAVVAGIVLALLGAPSAMAAGPGVSSAPTWFPLRGSHLIGCTYKTCVSGTYHPYWALDIKGTKGEAVYAAGAGKVVKAVDNQGNNCNPDKVALADCPDGARGNYVIIDHSGVFSYYQHFSAVSVKEGDWVDENTPIGAVGDSGWSTPGFFHLHFERRAPTLASRVDPGPLKGCAGGVLKTFPHDLTPAGSHDAWNVLPTLTYTASSDGTDCVKSTGGTPKPKVDLVFAIDSTGSMSPYIDAVTASARKITDSLFSTSDARVALVDYKDLYSSCPTDGYAARVDLPFTGTASDFGPAVDQLVAQGGCDTPESVYSGIMTALKLPWRAGAKRSVIVMGDAAPHDPEPTTNYTKARVVAAAKAGGVDVTGPVTGKASAARKRAAASGDGVSLYAVDIDSGGSPYFEDLASETGGQAYPASDPASAVDQITSAVSVITTSTVTAEAGGPYAGPVGKPITLDASGSAASEGIASYEWDFNNDGTYEVKTGSSSVTHTFAHRYHGKIGLRVLSAGATPIAATDVADITVSRATRTVYTGKRKGRVGHRVWLAAVVSSGHSPVKGVSVTFRLGKASCVDATGKRGRAGCFVRVPKAKGVDTVTASTATTTRYLGSADAVPFRVVRGRR